jgi:hypothetical protein
VAFVLLLEEQIQHFYHVCDGRHIRLCQAEWILIASFQVAGQALKRQT